jgi:mevalonate kinase
MYDIQNLEDIMVAINNCRSRAMMSMKNGREAELFERMSDLASLNRCLEIEVEKLVELHKQLAELNDFVMFCNNNNEKEGSLS